MSVSPRRSPTSNHPLLSLALPLSTSTNTHHPWGSASSAVGALLGRQSGQPGRAQTSSPSGPGYLISRRQVPPSFPGSPMSECSCSSAVQAPDPHRKVCDGGMCRRRRTGSPPPLRDLAARSIPALEPLDQVKSEQPRPRPLPGHKRDPACTHRACTVPDPGRSDCRVWGPGHGSVRCALLACSARPARPSRPRAPH